MGGRIMVEPACLLKKKFVAFNDIPYRGNRNQAETLVSAVSIKQRFNLFFPQARVILTKFSDIPDDFERDCRGPDPSGAGGVRNQRRQFPIFLSQSLPPTADELSVRSEGLPSGPLPITLVKPDDLHSLLCNLAFTKPPEAREHTLIPPVASYSTKYFISSGIVIHYCLMSQMYLSFFTIEYRKYSLGVRYSIYNPKYSFQFVHNFSLCKVDEIRYNKPA